MLSYLRRRWSLSGRDGFGALSPYADGGGFLSVIVDRNEGERRPLGWPDAESNTVSAWPDASGQFFPRAANMRTGTSGHLRDRRVRSGARGTANAKGRSDAVARPVMIYRTRPVVRECLLESTGRWHCGIWSIQVVRLVPWSAMRISGDRTPRRVRSILIGAFGHSSA
jgi:hypothetical protein